MTWWQRWVVPRWRALAVAGAVVVGVATLALAVTWGGDGDEGAEPASTVPTTAPTGTGSTAAPPRTEAPTTDAPTTEAPSTSAPASTAAPRTTVTTAPPVVEPATVVRRGDPSRRVVALTFDAGSDVGNAAAILDALATNGIRATFGMTGTWAAAHPELVARMAREGHQLVNHSDDHPSFTGFSTGAAPLTRAQRVEQLERADAAVRAAAGVSTEPWFRPPFGDLDDSVLVDVASAGYRFALMWTVDSLGWRGDDPASVLRRCLDRAEPGAIYLFHVGAASTDFAVLQEIIDGLRAQGYGFTTAAALVAP